MSTRPNSDKARAARASTWSFLARSARIDIALTPRSRASRATASASAWLVRALTTMWAPSPASFNAVARPILRPEPVIRATFPSSLPMRHPHQDVRDLYSMLNSVKQTKTGRLLIGLVLAVTLVFAAVPSRVAENYGAGGERLVIM